MLQIREDGALAETNDLRIQEEPPGIKIVKQDKDLKPEIKQIADQYGDVFKVTMHLQGCLACKRCSAFLNCRYLNPYIKLKLTGLAIRLYQKFWKEMNCRIFHDS